MYSVREWHPLCLLLLCFHLCLAFLLLGREFCVHNFTFHSYTLALQVGMTLSGSIPGILGLIQSPGAENPLFGITAFFCVMAIVMTGCCVCFCVLLAVQDRAIMPLSDQEITLDTVPFIAHSESQSQQSIDKPKRWYSGFWVSPQNLFICAFVENGALTQVHGNAIVNNSVDYYLCCNAIRNYDTADVHIIGTNSIANSLFNPPHKPLSPKWVASYWNYFASFCVYSWYFSCFSETTIVRFSLLFFTNYFSYDNAAVGGTLITLIYVFERIAISYSKTVVWMYANEQITLMQTNSSRLKWCGCAQQAGSFVGAFLFFILVNYSGLFVQ